MHAHPPFTLLPSRTKVAVYAPAERADTLPLLTFSPSILSGGQRWVILYSCIRCCGSIGLGSFSLNPDLYPEFRTDPGFVFVLNWISIFIIKNKSLDRQIDCRRYLQISRESTNFFKHEIDCSLLAILDPVPPLFQAMFIQGADDKLGQTLLKHLK